ncbi:MAG: TrkA family potassium uptake protein [Bacteroidales bacterium]|jgi:trk system potassium uptake protein TrkA|nr:TrkA family potassium uptake protein [Bacteroidales bacterium]
MKFIIIGLGNFGFALAEKLTQQGHEVIGVDKNIDKIEEIKDKITHAICLDCSHQAAVNSLPLKNTDVVIVAIGEDVGGNLLTTALIKKMGVPRLISRSISNIHETILESMEITEIVRPEVETAERWAKKLTSSGLVDSFELTDKYSVVEVVIHEKFAGKSIEEIGFNKDYNVIVLTVMKSVKDESKIGIVKKSPKFQIEGVAKAETILNEGDIMVLYGTNKDIRSLLKD